MAWRILKPWTWLSGPTRFAETPRGASPAPLPAPGERPWTIPLGDRDAPGPAHGVLDWLRKLAAPWVGPQRARGSRGEIALTQEAVAASPRGVIMPQFLPYLDDYSGESEEMRRAYRRMMGDPNIKAAFLGKILAVAGLDLQLAPASKKNDRDQEIADFVRYVLTQRIRGGWPELIWSILSGGLIDGYAVLAKVWAYEQRGKWAGKYVLRALKAQDTGSDLVLQVNEFREVVGVLGLRYNAGLEFHPSEFLIWRNLALYNQPTGTSDLRAVYSRYWLLDTALKLRAIACERRAMPILLGHYPDNNATVKASLEAGLKLASSQNWLSAPVSAQVEALNIAGQADEIFKSTIADLKHDVFLGIQGAILQALEGETTDGRGNSQVHQSTSDRWPTFLATTIAAVLNDREGGLVKDLVDLNYVADEYPTATLSAVDVNDLTQEITVDTGLHALGLDLSKAWLYDHYGREMPLNDDDKLPGQQSPPAGGPAGPGGGQPPGGGGLPFDEPAPPEAPTDFTDDDPHGSASREVAPAGPDGRKAEQLLRRSVRQGVEVLHEIARPAVERLLQGSPRPDRLFTAAERRQLAEALAATNATADLLGRARIRRRLEQARKHAGRFSEATPFSEQPTDFSCFRDSIEPMAPHEALDYFHSLIPMLGIDDPGRWGEDQHRVAFTLAEATEEKLLERVHQIIDRALREGTPRQGVEQIDQVLEQAGVTPKNPSYSEMLMRTNAMDAYTTGATKEMQDPDVMGEFPMWKFVGIRDGRQRPAHERHFDRYYPNTTTFAEVRDSVKGSFDGYNCRCNFIPIHHSEWTDLERRGARLSRFSEWESFAAAGKQLYTGKKTVMVRGKPQEWCWENGRRVSCNPDKTKPKKPAATGPEPEKMPRRAAIKPPRLTLEETHAHIQELLSHPDRATWQKVAQLAQHLHGHTVAELNMLKKKLGLRASGSKVVLAAKLAEQALKKLPRPTSQKPAATPPGAKAFRPEAHIPTVVGAIRATGGDNLASLVDVRKALAARGLGRDQQDQVIQKARKQGAVSGVALEGRHGISKAEHDAAIIDRDPNGGEDRIGYLSIKGEENGQPKRGPAPREAAKDRGPVAEEARRPADTGAGKSGSSGDKPARAKPAARVPAQIHEVNGKLDRYADLFRKKGQHEAANWMGMLKDHINAVGVDSALAALGPEVAGKGEDVQYGGAQEISDFAENYLSRVGISLIPMGGAADEEGGRVVSSVAPSEEGIAARGKKGDVHAALQTLKNKLEETKHLPGLESSKDLGDLMGTGFGSKVSHFSPDVMKKLDETYGEGKWIVRPYTDEAYGGYGIFFPDRVKQIQQDAKQALWDSGVELSKYGFEHLRDTPGNDGFAAALGGKAPVVDDAKFRIGHNLGGQEQDVYYDEKNDRYNKIARQAGGQNESQREFLERHIALNALWPQLGYRMEGVTADGKPVLSMNAIGGTVPTAEEVRDYLLSNGWVPQDEGHLDPDGRNDQWKNLRAGVVIDDTHEGNWKKTHDGHLLPIDINVLPGDLNKLPKPSDQPRVVGIRHQDGNVFRFGSKKYEQLYGDVRHWGDRAAHMASSEHGADIDQWSPKAEEGKAGGGTGENFPTARFMVSPAFPVVGITNEERAQGVTFKKGQEGRVHIHTRNGKAEIVPHSTWLKKEAMPVVFENDDTRAMAQAAVDAINALPESERKGQLYAPDIIKTADGFRVVEANPANEAGASGYLADNPFIIDAYASHVTGREPAHVRFIRRLLSKKAKGAVK